MTHSKSLALGVVGPDGNGEDRSQADARVDDGVAVHGHGRRHSGHGESAGAAQASLPMPSTANWLGASLWFQALALDGAANAFGLATSNGVRAKIGV